MVLLSVTGVTLALTLHRASGHSPARPISFELAERNPLAWLLVACLIAVAGVLARGVAARGYVVRTILLVLSVPCLVIIGVTKPQATLHTGAFVVLVMGGGAWFLLMAVEMGKHALLAASAIAAVVLPVLGLIAPGVAQKLFVIYAVTAANVVYHGLDNLHPEPAW